MRYLNQKNYGHIPYVHDVSHGGVPESRRSVATSGCGLCCLCMMVDRLTTRKLEIDECVRWSEECGANVIIGTRMAILGPLVAEQYGLEFSSSNRIEDLLDTLRNGGCGIVNVGGDHNDHTGIFSHGGHYILALYADQEDICILDPSYTADKYSADYFQDKVKVSVPFLYCTPEVLASDCTNKEIPYFLFRRKKPQ